MTNLFEQSSTKSSNLYSSSFNVKFYLYSEYEYLSTFLIKKSSKLLVKTIVDILDNPIQIIDIIKKNFI